MKKLVTVLVLTLLIAGCSNDIDIMEGYSNENITRTEKDTIETVNEPKKTNEEEPKEKPEKNTEKETKDANNLELSENTKGKENNTKGQAQTDKTKIIKSNEKQKEKSEKEPETETNSQIKKDVESKERAEKDTEVNKEESAPEADDLLDLLWPVPENYTYRPYGKTKNGYRVSIFIPAEIGTKVIASTSGKVSRIGQVLSIKVNDEIDILYHGLREHKVGLGDKVEKGDIIGTSHTPPNFTSPVIVFQVMKKGSPVDPMDYIAEKNDYNKLPEPEGLSPQLSEEGKGEN